MKTPFVPKSVEQLPQQRHVMVTALPPCPDQIEV